MSKKRLIITDRNIGLIYGHINRFLNKKPVAINAGIAYSMNDGTCVIVNDNFTKVSNTRAVKNYPISEPRTYICKIFINDSPKRIMVIDKYCNEAININPGDKMLNDGQCMRIFHKNHSLIIAKHMDIEDIEVYHHKIKCIIKTIRDTLYYLPSDKNRSINVFEELMNIVQQLESTLENSYNCKKNIINIISIVNHIGVIKFTIDYSQFIDASNMNTGITYACTYADGTTATCDSISKLFRDIMNHNDTMINISK